MYQVKIITEKSEYLLEDAVNEYLSHNIDLIDIKYNIIEKTLTNKQLTYDYTCMIIYK